MYSKTKAIVLSKIKYREHDLIVNCYTSRDGIASYMLRGVLKSKKCSKKVAYFQPLSQLEIEQNCRSNQSLRNIREIKPLVIYRTLHTHIEKSAIVMFLSEVLSNVLKEEEADENLYNYIETALQWLDVEERFANFHLLFLLKLTQYLGFYPELEHENLKHFNLQTGLFEKNVNSIYTLSGKNVEVLKRLLGTNFDALYLIQMSSTQRLAFLNMLLLYFELHLGSFKKPKSLEILNQIFK